VGTEGFIAPEGAGAPQADIYSLGKVLYEISTGKDRNEYPVLPSPLEDNAEDRDLIRFNKIVLNACRVDLGRRYESADEMMTDLLAFQFSHYDPRVEKARRRLIRAISIMGPIVALCVIIAMLWRLIWLLEHAHH
jgi:serine/threonine protein kinase